VASRKRKRSRRHRQRKRRLLAATGRPRAARSRPRAAVKTCPKLLYVSGKGLGVGPNPNGPNPYKINDDNALEMHYLPSIVNGNAGLLDFPSDARITALTRDANRQLLPTNAQAAPAGTPLRVGGPIKHVFYIVKENRTYDQVLGDDPRGDGDASIALFGRQVTPNAHALAERFPLLDHVYANSEASIDGHFWADAAKSRTMCTRPGTRITRIGIGRSTSARTRSPGPAAASSSTSSRARDQLVQLRRGGRQRRAAGRQGPHAG